MATLCALLCLLATAADETDLEKARRRVRALESEIVAVVAEVAPAVGAVLNHATFLDEKTGAVSVRPRSMGSGVLISQDGFFLTNVHVVEGAGYLTVTLPDGVAYTATLFADTSEGKVKGDIALLKLKGDKKFPYADWRSGKPRQLEPGTFVFALGNPHGHALDGTPVVTMGILSGKGRAAAESRYLYVDALQTDAEINPGNSGGPLFDSRGNLIGINGLMASRQRRSNSGVGFAIPIDQIRLFLGKLLKDEGGGLGYGYHGLQVSSAAGEKGAQVLRVERGSPAEKAGLRPQDVVIKVNGTRVSNRTDFVNILGKLPEGSRVRISYKRKRRGKMTDFKLVAYADYLRSVGRTPGRKDGTLPLNERGYLGVHWEKGRAGLRITRIVEGTGAERAELRVDDILVEVAGVPVQEPKAVIAELARHAAGERVRVLVMREGKPVHVRVELSDAAEAAGVGE